MEGVRKVHERYTGGAWEVCGMCTKGVWKVHRRLSCDEDIRHGI